MPTHVSISFFSVPAFLAPMAMDEASSEVEFVPAERRCDSAFDSARYVEAAKGRDENAATRLVAELYPMVIRIVRKRISAGIAEEDVAQEIFIKIFRKLHQYRGKAAFEHWVSRIAVNTCANVIRSHCRRREVRRADLSASEEAALTFLNCSTDESNPSQQVAARDLLNQLLARLKPKERIALEMVELEGYTAEEAAEFLHCSAMAVRVRILRARQKLRRSLETLIA